jgi:hypothetical protein
MNKGRKQAMRLLMTTVRKTQKMPSHYNALLVVAIALPDLAGGPARGPIELPTPNGCVDGGNSLFGTLIARISGFDVPDVRLQDVSTASDSHFGKVAHGILCLDVTCSKPC